MSGSMFIRDLNTTVYNPRKITKEQLERLRRSLQEFGDLSGVVFNRRTGSIIGGNQRVKCLPSDARIEKKEFSEPTRTGTVAMGVISIDGEMYVYREVDWPLEREKAANIAANQHGGEFDEELLAPLLAEFRELPDFKMDLLGFNDKEISSIIKRGLQQEEVEEDIDGKIAAEISGPVRTQPGDLYILGGHRVLCGDCTNADNISRLMDGKLAAMVYTDPPYGIDYESENPELQKIQNDDLKRDQLTMFLHRALLNAKNFAQDTAAFYIWHASQTRRDFEWAIDAIGLEERQYIVWVKEHFSLGKADYHWQTEPCFYCQKAGQRAKYTGDRRQTTVWRVSLGSVSVVGQGMVIDNGVIIADGQGNELFIRCKAPENIKPRLIRLREGQQITLLNSAATDAWEIRRDNTAEYIHPTQKPVDLAVKAILNSSEPGDILVDLFLGSGSALIAAEKTGRRCYGAELEPKYCDAIVDRWEKYTGKKAELIRF